MYRNQNHSRPAPAALPARAFTLIELLTVIAIIGILAAILIPTVSAVRDSARAANCASNMRQIGQAAYMYAEDNDGWAPPAFDRFAHERHTGSTTGTSIFATFHFGLWPYIYETPFPGSQAVQTSLANGSPSSYETVFHCPARHASYPHANQAPGRIFISGNTENFGSARYSYGVNTLAARGERTDEPVNLESLSAASRTVFVGETYYWYVNFGWHWTRFGVVPHNETANHLFYDGHVERLSRNDIPPQDQARNTVFWAGDNARN